MSKRRRKSGPGLTLFAFQDIIMSTSGIIIMIVLLLTLELVERKTSGSQSVAPFEIRKIADEIELIETKIISLQERLKQSDEIVQTASDLSPGDLRRQIDELQGQSDALTQTVNKLQVEWKAASSRNGRLTQEQRELLSTRKTLAGLKREQSRIQAEIETLVTENRPIFKFPQRDRRSGWLTVVASDKVQVAPLEKAARPVTFQSKPGLLNSRNAAELFLQWIDAENATSAYFFLIVRPDGVEAFTQIAEKLDQRSIRYGFDLTGQDQVILNAERGAVQ